MIMARATGWTEYYIKHMPLKILLQYVHAWLVQEGNATRWAYATGQNNVPCVPGLLKSSNRTIHF